MTASPSPASADDLCDLFRAGAAAGEAVELVGGASKRAIGNPARTTRRIDLSAFRHVIDYDPAELLLTVGAAAPLADVERLLASEGQMLAFEPFDHGALSGGAGGTTIGGIIGAAVSGPRRLSAGAVRDHMLAFEAVSGRGERFKGGAAVMKNVTGYDLPKLMTGSWGQLAALTSVTLKVVPRPEVEATLLFRIAEDRAAVEAMAAAMGSPAEVSGAAHLPEDGITALRLEGFAPSVAARSRILRGLLGPADAIEGEESHALWRRIREAAPLAGEDILWRACVAPSAGPALGEALRAIGGRHFYDWAGGLVWLSLPRDADQAPVREHAGRLGGQAMLARAPDDLRRRLSALHPSHPDVAALTRRVKTAFDPAAILDPARWEAPDAD